MKEMTTEAAINNLDSVIDFISCELEEKNICIKIQNNVKIAAEEIFVNIANYAYANTNVHENVTTAGSAVIRIDVNDESSEIIIEFEDSGVRYNPLEKEDPDISAPIEDRDIGGLGVFMVKKLMDIVEYRYENGRNIVIIRKKY